MKKDLIALLPEIFLLGGAVLTLFVGSFSPRDRQSRALGTAVLAVLAACGASIAAFATQSTRMIYEYGFAIDPGTNATRLIVTVTLLLVLTLSYKNVRARDRETEFYVLLLLIGLGTLGMAAATDLLVLQVTLLLISIPTSALIGWARTPAATEATLKFFLLGALSSVLTVTGITLIFGAAGTTSYRQLTTSITDATHAAVVAGTVAILAGLLFEAGAAPMHFWLPDAAEGATTPAAAAVTTVPKLGALVALYRLFAEPLHSAPMHWPVLLGVIAAVTMTLGNLGAFRQDNPRRLLGYSTISQSGYLLMAVAVAGYTDLALQALLFYLAAYALANVGAFAVVAELPQARTVGGYAGLARQNPGLAVALTICLLALVGTPPTAVFFGKLSIFSATGAGGAAWLVVIGAINTVLSLFYYLRWLAPTFLGDSATTPVAALQPAGRWSRWAALTASGGIIALGVASGAGFALFGGVLASG